MEQETLHFDPGHEHAPPLRSKEEAQDYRYLPEPDLVPIEPPAEMVERPARRSPSRRARASSGWRTELDYGLAEELVTSGATGSTSRRRATGAAVANVLMNEFARPASIRPR